MALTVGYDATAAVRQAAGIGRYARQLLAALADRSDDIRYRLFSLTGGSVSSRLPPLDGRFRHRSYPVSDRIMNAVWQRARVPVPVQLLTGRVDVFHSPDFTLPPLAGRPSVLTIHDLAFRTVPECAFPSLRAYLEQVVPRNARRATRVIAVSEQTRRDVVEYLEVPADQVTTILEGVGPEFRPAEQPLVARAEAAALGIDRPYLLAVGTLEPRKNYVRLLEAYARLRERGVEQLMVIAGRPGWLYEPILRRIDELSLGNYVRLVQPDDRVLVALYQAADVFVFPSLYEGFGIPPLEALACGTPVACSATSSLPEVVGDAALTFDALNVDAIVEAVEHLLSDRELRAVLVRRGKERAAEMTWARAAAETVQVYREVADA